jgi:hypothetical protein
VADDYSGFGDVISGLLGGNNASYDAAFQGAMSKRLSVDKLMAQAQMERQKAMAMDEFSRQQDLDPTTRNVTLGGMGSDYHGAQLGAGVGQENALRQSLIDSFSGKSPALDPARMNTGLSILQGQPMTTAQNTAGGIINPHGNPGVPPVITDLVKTVMGANSARAGASNASAGASDALASLRGDQQANPGKYHTSRGGKTASDPYGDTVIDPGTGARAPKPDTGGNTILPHLDGSKTKAADKALHGVPHPKKGDVKGGFVYLGGDPNSKASWKKK